MGDAIKAKVVSNESLKWIIVSKVCCPLWDEGFLIGLWKRELWSCEDAIAASNSSSTTRGDKKAR